MKVFGITDPVGSTGTMYTDQIKIADDAVIDGCEVVTYVPELDLIEANGELFALESQLQEAQNTILRLRAENAKLAEMLRGLRPLVSYGGTY